VFTVIFTPFPLILITLYIEFILLQWKLRPEKAQLTVLYNCLGHSA